MNVNLETDKIKNLILNFLVPIISFGLSAVLFLVIIYPGIKQVPLAQAELGQQKLLRDLLSEKNAKLHRFVDFKTVLEENSMLVSQVVPDEQNVPGLLDQLNRIAVESGLSLTKLSYSVADSTIRDESATAYNAVLVSLGAEGTYNQMVSFMEAVENASRAVNVANYRFSETSDDTNRISITFILTAPYLSVQSSAVTDEAINLDITTSEFTNFINKIKGFRYFDQSGDLSTLAVPVEIVTPEEAVETTPSTE
jgi:Tfp pilus assembly protein PilO